MRCACGEAILKKPNETKKRYKQRKYCSKECYYNFKFSNNSRL